MSAQVVSYSAAPFDTTLSLKVECLDCHAEGGWTWDRKGATDKLQVLADKHNEDFHA